MVNPNLFPAQYGYRYGVARATAEVFDDVSAIGVSRAKTESRGCCSLASNTENLDSTNWTRINSAIALKNYTAGSFQRNKNISIGETDGNGTWIGFALEYQAGYLGNFPGIRVITSPGFSKNNTQQMTFTFQLAWGREYM